MLGGSTLDSQTLGEIKETDLLEVLKNYYCLCRQQQTSRRTLIKDQTLIQLLSALLNDRRQAVAVYVSKLLLLLSEFPEDAKQLASTKEIKIALDNALSSDCNVLIQPRVARKLLIVQTRLLKNANPQMQQAIKSNQKTIFGKAASGNKLLVFEIECPSEVQRRDMERKCIAVPGVVSVCFQQIKPDEIRCLIRCMEVVEDKTLIRTLMTAGNVEMLKQLVRGSDGQTEAFDFYASQLQLEQTESKNVKELPKYLDDEQLFAMDQCIATNEQVEAEKQTSAGWISSLKSFFW